MSIPTLTTEQRQHLTILLQQVEITQLRLEAAQAEAKRCHDTAEQQLRALTVEGFTLDLQKMEYVPVPAPAGIAPEKVDL